MKNKPKKRIDEPSEQMKRYADNRASGMNKKQSALKAGYAETTASTVKTQIENKPSFEKLLDKIGLTKDLVCKALTDDIKAKPKFRVPELQLASKILGIEKTNIDITTKNLTITFDSAFKEAQNNDLSDLNKKDD